MNSMGKKRSDLIAVVRSKQAARGLRRWHNNWHIIDNRERRGEMGGWIMAARKEAVITILIWVCVCVLREIIHIHRWVWVSMSCVYCVCVMCHQLLLPSIQFGIASHPAHPIIIIINFLLIGASLLIGILLEAGKHPLA